ncbi:MAG: hypothetical protein L0Z50_33850, partial [Verrucomicrobiales bacterium]|nr:hypothetical protein [Verrucomicrobiales bacterium]
MKRGTAAILAAAILGLAGASWFCLRNRPGSWRPAQSVRKMATRVLGEHLSTRFPGAKALVVANPFTQRAGQSAEIHGFDKAGIRGLQEGFQAKDSIKVVYPELRSEFDQNPQSVYVDPKTTTPLSFLVADEAFDRLAKSHPDCALIISLIGVPLNLRQSEIWREPDRPRWGLLLPDWRIVGDRAAIREAVKSGKIAA